MPFDLDNIDCWRCGKEIPLRVERTCHLCGALYPEESPWEHITSREWQRVLRRLAIGALLVGLTVIVTVMLARLLSM